MSADDVGLDELVDLDDLQNAACTSLGKFLTERRRSLQETDSGGFPGS
jgi:hypothetical protein